MRVSVNAQRKRNDTLDSSKTKGVYCLHIVGF